MKTNKECGVCMKRVVLYCDECDIYEKCFEHKFNKFFMCVKCIAMQKDVMEIS